MRWRPHLAAALLLACCGGPKFETPVTLPASPRGRVVDTSAWPVLHLTRQGEILFGEEVVRFDQLAARLENVRREYEAAQKAKGEPAYERGEAWESWQRSTQPVVVCVDARAPFQHAAWLFGVLAYHDFNDIHLGVRGGRVLPAPFVTKFWGGPAPASQASGQGMVLSRVVVCATVLQGADGVTYELGSRNPYLYPHETLRKTERLSKLRRWLRRERRRVRTAEKIEPLGTLDMDCRVPFQEFVSALNAFHAARIRHVEWGRELPHPWVVAQERLPRAKQARIIGSAPGDLYFISVAQRDTFPLTLPLASAAVLDRGDDPDDRTILNLDRRGALHWRGQAKSPQELGAILRYAKERYDLKMRAKDTGNGYEYVPGVGRFSRLYVLVRADKDTPWQRVSRLLALLRKERFYKLQFACMRTADVRYSREEAELLGAEWEERIPTRPEMLAAKLSCPLPLHARAAELKTTRVRLVKQADDVVSFAVGARRTTDLAELGRWIRGAQAAEIDPAPDVPHKFVVAVLNQLRAAGIEQVEFAE